MIGRVTSSSSLLNALRMSAQRRTGQLSEGGTTMRLPTASGSASGSFMGSSTQIPASRTPSAAPGSQQIGQGSSTPATTTTPVYETRAVYEDRPIYTTVPTYAPQGSTGQKEWTRLLAGNRGSQVGEMSNFGDTTWDIATGKDGAIFTVGVVETRSSGAIFDGQSLSKFDGTDGFLTKYNTDGSIAWSKGIGDRGYDRAMGVTVGNDGSVYVAGSIGDANGTVLSFDGQTTAGVTDAFVSKYYADGTKAWTRVVGSLTGQEVGLDVKVDESGSVYLAGSVRNTTILDGQTWNGVDNESFVTKFDANGNKAWTRLSGGQQWVHTHSGFQGTTEETIGRTQITLGRDGMVYLAARNESGGADKVYKFDSAGTKQGELVIANDQYWTQAAEISGIETGLDGSIYVTGNTGAGLEGNTYLGGGEDAFLTKFNADGTKAWTKQFGGRGDDYGVGLTVGTDGKIYVAGTTASSFADQINNYDPNNTTSGNYFDAFVTQFNTDGTQGWTKLVGSDRLQEGYSVTAGLDGAIYLGGRTTGNLDGQSLANYFDTTPHTIGPQSFTNGRGATFLTKLSANSSTPTGTTQVQTGTNRVQVGTEQVQKQVGSTTSTAVSQPGTQTGTTNSSFKDFRNNLSSIAPTTSATASTDAQSLYRDMRSRREGSARQRAAIARRYLGFR